MTHQEALLNGKTRYFGMLCTKHPEALGERAVSGAGCVKCRLEAVKRHQKKHPEKRKAQSAKDNSKNPELRSAAHKAWREANVEKDAARKQRYRVVNLEKVKGAYKKYYEENYTRMLAKRNKQHADKLQRTPVWLTVDELWMVEQAYELAAERTKLFGFPWHVDHVLPLRGKTISGFHTPYNLQVIPAVENLRKSNRVTV
jgi:2,4-dienoyl-CoA reductase-like NADH-dependent reductase (Old Yellow Enzyme family)